MSSASLEAILKSWTRRLRMKRSLAWTGYGALAGGMFAAFLAAFAFATHSLLAEEYLRWATAGWIASAAAGFMVGLLVPVNRKAAARKLDIQFDLKERISTALEIESLPAATPFRTLQLEDAVRQARSVNVRKRLPIRPPWAPWFAALILLLGNGIFWFSGEALFSAARQNRQIQNAIQQEAGRIEQLIESIEADPNLTEAQKDALTAPLEQALDELAQAQSLEEAFSALEEAQEQLAALEDPGAQDLAEQLRRTGQAFSETGVEPLDELAQRLAEGDFSGAADALQEMDVSSLNSTEREALVEQLESLAEAAQSQDSSLAQALQQAAEAAQNGNAAEAQEALQAAADALEVVEQQNASSQAAAEAAANLQQGQQAILEAGQAPGESVAEAGSGQEGSDGGQQAQGPGSGAGDSSGNSGSQVGSEAGNDEISQDNNPDGIGESSFQPISPSSIGGEGSDWVAIPSSEVPGDQVIGAGPADPGADGPLTVPYTEVFSQYQDAVNKAIDSGLIPPQYRDLIRDYFTALEP